MYSYVATPFFSANDFDGLVKFFDLRLGFGRRQSFKISGDYLDGVAPDFDYALMYFCIQFIRFSANDTSDSFTRVISIRFRYPSEIRSQPKLTYPAQPLHNRIELSQSFFLHSSHVISNKVHPTWTK